MYIGMVMQGGAPRFELEARPEASSNQLLYCKTAKL
jgi:hypothetical protein